MRSKRSPGYLTFPRTPSASAMSASCPCSQQMSTFPGPGKALAAEAAPAASSRSMEVLGVRPRSVARGCMVSSGRERAPSVVVGVVSLGLRWLASIFRVDVEVEGYVMGSSYGVLALYTFFGIFGEDIADIVLTACAEDLPEPLGSF